MKNLRRFASDFCFHYFLRRFTVHLKTSDFKIHDAIQTIQGRQNILYENSLQRSGYCTVKKSKYIHVLIF